MPYIPVGKNIVDRINFSLKDVVEAGQVLTTSASGDWQPLSTSSIDSPIGIVSGVSEDGHTAVIRMTGSDLIYRGPTLPTLPTIDPATITTDGTLRLEGATPEFIEYFQNMMSPGSRLVVNGDEIRYAQGPQRTVKYSPTTTAKKTRKPRKKQEKIKTIKDQMKDIP